MLRPASSHIGYQNQLRISLDRNSVTVPEDSEYCSRASTATSPTSLYSKTPSFIRPFSSLLTRSIDGATEASWFQRTTDAHLTSSGPTTRSRQSSFHSSRSRLPSPSPWKSPSWTKVLNGYVSPRNTSRLFQPLKRKKSKAASLNQDYIFTRRKRKTIAQRDTITRVASRELHVHSTLSLPSQDPSSYEQDAASHPQRNLERRATVAVSPGKFVLSVAVSHAILFCIIPPRYVISVGGGGMFLVYIILLLALVCLCWAACEEDVSMQSSTPFTCIACRPPRRSSVHSV